jgi:hypothetical protein
MVNDNTCGEDSLLSKRSLLDKLFVIQNAMLIINHTYPSKGLFHCFGNVHYVFISGTDQIACITSFRSVSIPITAGRTLAYSQTSK